MGEKLLVSPSPHVRAKGKTSLIMLMVIVALLPSCVYGVLNFGMHALLILVLSTGSAVAAELVYELVMRKEITVTDGSAAVTGLLIGMNMPPMIAWWIPVIGSVFAIVVVKQLFGGLGRNFMNPALAARCFLVLAFSAQMTAFTTGTGVLSQVTEPTVMAEVGAEADAGANETAGTDADSTATAWTEAQTEAAEKTDADSAATAETEEKGKATAVAKTDADSAATAETEEKGKAAAAAKTDADSAATAETEEKGKAAAAAKTDADSAATAETEEKGKAAAVAKTDADSAATAETEETADAASGATAETEAAAPETEAQDSGKLDAVSTATPLKYLKKGQSFDLKALFLGNTPGTIGETSALLLLIGGIFLMLLGVIDWRIPVFYIGSFGVLVLITAAARGYDAPLQYMLQELFAGGLMMGAFFMATDYVSSPYTKSGRILFALIIGVMTWLYRMFGMYKEGVSNAIILANCLTPLIDRLTRPVAFGIRKKEASS
ncbi:RnfABCDGE type electron transport complex subunit D [Porcincola intestinalis]|uniref:RnfABCDGE type electron transport complex subunit D n=1 Tax=Porcincola intestinalis TaxID=2606632 RepID=UPI0023F0A279|nr:RnfABCDGE type electron transport complex subunit D [Porcincola intestinalis]MCI6767691.1 RnfABCDGE type electron transport complex subunit D [Lachnospiraceae bacterium]MDD7060447.1 RnfABCDGE type electron transport complex subunit D [Porcincola intestinalis]MDY5282467.1 RnfABCDGE type electron transport complex subunit D [Porcincola intestinalis]